MRKVLLFLLLVAVVTVILATWGSVGSAILTLALLIALGYIALNRFLETHSPDDYQMEE